MKWTALTSRPFAWRYMYSRLSAALTLLIYALAPQASTVLPQPCELEASEIPESPAMNLVQSDCLGTHCWVVFKFAPSIENFKFKYIHLEMDKKPKLNLELAVKRRGDFLFSEVTGEANFLEKIELHTTYTAGQNCVIGSGSKLTYNKTRNRMDATVIAPIR